jgi:hypothetical protein
MKVEKTEIPDSLKLRGRPMKYPFDKLNPGQRIVMPIQNDSKKERRMLVQACYQYKKFNSLKWVTASLIEGNNIVLYRIS